MRGSSHSFGGQRAMGVLIWLLGSAIALPAWAGFCTGKQNGMWCDGSNLVNCQGGNVSSSKNCPSGCQSNPPGVADVCKGASGPCTGKQNGLWCNGNDLLNCQGGNVASSQGCSSGCQQNPPGVPDQCKAASGPCNGKADGAWCNGSDLMQCKGGNVASSQNCPQSCQSNPAGVADVCKSAQPQGFCSGKGDGAYCDGNDLKQCKGGNVASSQGCANGCQQNSAGSADQCKASEPTGFCSGKSDGAFCEGDKLTQCQGGKVASSSACKAGCQQNPAGMADACKPEGPPPSGFCASKANGPWCNGNSLVQCSGGNIQSSKGCPLGCKSNPAGVPDACQTEAGPDPVGGIPAGFCGSKQNGAWCNGNQLITCNGGGVVAAMGCALGCQQNPPGTADSCTSPADSGGCGAQPDGQWCQGGALVNCKAGKQVAAMSCAGGCLAMGGNGAATCSLKTKGFCAGKTDGAWCDAGLLSTCKGGKVASAFPCPKGCEVMPNGVPDQCKPDLPPANSGGGALKVSEKNGCAVFSGNVNLWAGKGLKVYDQKAYGDQLGTCPGLTIHSSGCTITSLSMLHEYLGLNRQVDGKNGNTPDLENAWRKAHDGYGHTKYDGKEGDCLVYWSKTAGGLVPAPHYNDSNSCLSVSAAQAIASSLNAGMPVVVSVHWAGGNPAWYGGSENWHWVLVVGADAQGLILNDPWGGKQEIRPSQGGLGSYVIDTVYTFFFGPGGPNLSIAALDETGEPMADEKLPNSLEQIPGDGVDPGVDAGPNGGDAGATDGAGWAGVAGAGSSAKSSGCASGPTGSAAAVLLAMAMLAVVWARRRRTA